MIMDRLEIHLALAGVKDGIGVRLQNFIAAFSSRSSKAAEQPEMEDSGSTPDANISPIAP